MALLEVTLRARVNDQQHINKFNYVSTGTPASVSLSFALTSAMGFIPVGGIYPPSGVFALIQAYTTAALQFFEVEARDVYSVTDFYVLPFAAGTAGTYAGESMSPAVAMGFRTNRVRTDIRRGTRRISGISETLTGAGGAWTSAAAEAMDDIAAAMSATLAYDDEGNTLSFAPVVVKKEWRIGESGKYAYRYFEDEAEQLQNVATGVIWTPYPTVRTQVSRQYGRGA